MLANDGIAGGESGTIANDTDGDGRADTAYDAVAAQQWDVELAAGATVVLTLTTTFGVEGSNGAPLAVDDADTTDEDAFVDVDVLTNDDGMDGDELEVAAVVAAGGRNGGPECGRNDPLHAGPRLLRARDLHVHGLGRPGLVVGDGVRDRAGRQRRAGCGRDSATVPEDGVIEVDARLNDSTARRTRALRR